MSESAELRDIPIDNITISKENARRTLDVYSGLDELAASINQLGLQQPVVVFPIAGQKDKFELIVGQRRLLACKNKLHWKKIPSMVLTKPMNSIDALAYSFVENIHRLDLDYKDKISATMKLINELGDIHSVAKKLQVSETTIRNYLGYAAVPEQIKELVESKKLSKKTAVRISKTNIDDSRAIAIAAKVTEAPRREDRNAIIQTSIDHPNYSAEKVAEEAPRLKFKRFTLDLTDTVADALELASSKYDMEPDELVIQILVEYLKNEGFFKT
jgi:ParB family chromosome partitioning protein